MSKQNKIHYLVFSKSGNQANIVKFIDNQMMNLELGFANPCISTSFDEFVRLKSKEINSITDLVIISIVHKQDYIEDIVSADFILINNNNRVLRRHMLPFLMGCYFDINTLSQACKDRCNLIELP